LYYQPRQQEDIMRQNRRATTNGMNIRDNRVGGTCVIIDGYRAYAMPPFYYRRHTPKGLFTGYVTEFEQKES
jgi:hypothetical protein